MLPNELQNRQMDSLNGLFKIRYYFFFLSVFHVHVCVCVCAAVACTVFFATHFGSSVRWHTRNVTLAPVE